MVLVNVCTTSRGEIAWELVANVPRLADIPAYLINGRLDISGPPDIAWQLAQAWPRARLVLTDDAGHGSAHPSTFQAIIDATTALAGSP